MSSSADKEEILRLQSIANFLDGYVILGLIIIVFLRHKKLRQISNCIFLMNLFLSNLISLWSTRFPRSILAITGTDLLFGNIVYCKIRWLFGRWSFYMSYIYLCLSCIDRYLSTSRHERLRSLITFKRAVIITIIISLIYFIIFIPDAIYYSGYRCTASSSDREMYKQFLNYFNLVMCSSVPMVILGTFSVLTWHNLYSTRNISHTKLHRQVNLMMIVEFTVIFLGATPNFVFSIYTEVTQSMVKSSLRVAQETVVRNACVICSFILYVGTFYIYMIMSSVYRQNNFTQLETIECTIDHNCGNKTKFHWPIGIQKLKLTFMISMEYCFIFDSLLDLSQLIKLEIYQITSQAPIFAENLKQLIISYSTPFYIEEKQWFIVYHICSNPTHQRNIKSMIFYTLPYPLEALIIQKNSFKNLFSNSSRDNHRNIYQNIKTLTIEDNIKPNNTFNRCNIIKLVVNSEFQSIYWLNILNKLEEFHIDTFGCVSIEQFRILFDNTPRLYSLTLKKSQLIKLTDNWRDIHICNHLSEKIRLLKFQSYKNLFECLNRYEIEQLVSIFKNKCECLSIGIQTNSNTVDYILIEMLALNYLFVFIPKNTSSQRKESMTKQLTMEWLETQQTRFNRSNCIIYNYTHGNYFLL
ncbi:hypothetical protein I4U23_022598 [Adineta vaga]|nr:hypothetical protein I4U23_022598 [Adineta vaga]